jgi:transposase
VEYLPGYAPELNPIEYIWGYWKQRALRNVCPKDYWGLDVNKTLKADRGKSLSKRCLTADIIRVYSCTVFGLF